MKMKLILLSMVAMATLASCQKDNSTGGDDNPTVTPGIETYATFNFNIEGSKTGTRANMAEDGNAENAAIIDARILVFDGIADDSKLVANVLSNGFKSKTIKTTSGEKRIFVFANTGAATPGVKTKLDALVDGTTTLSNFYALMSNEKGAAETEVAGMGPEFTEMHLATGMVMSNVANATNKFTLAANVGERESQDAAAGAVAKNHFSIEVRRTLAKGSVVIAMANPGTKDGYTFQGDLTYGVRNVNRSVNYVQRHVGGYNVAGGDVLGSTVVDERLKAPYYNVFDAADLTKLETFAPYYYGKFPITNGSPAVGDVAKVAAKGAAAAAPFSVYFTENSNAKRVKGNTTYFGITATLGNIDADKVAGTFVVDGATKGIVTTAGAAIAPATTFYLIRNLPTGFFFGAGDAKRCVIAGETAAYQAIYDILTAAEIITPTQYADAAALKAAHAISPIINMKGGGTTNLHNYFGVYNGGKCYYRLNIYETAGGATPTGARTHKVRRNHVYNAKVTGFTTIGEPTEGDLDNEPEKPVDAEITHVTATISVKAWVSVGMEDEL